MTRSDTAAATTHNSVNADPSDGDVDDLVRLDEVCAGKADREIPRNEAARWAHARCNDGSGGLVDVFFSQRLPDIARAKRLCATCPALIPCLEGALERREPWGVWGGQLFLNGTILATRRPRGRPPKVPRPEDQLPEIPLPAHLRGVAVVRSA